MRLMASLGHASLPEITLANGRRADVLVLAQDGTISIVEIKSCLADFRADRKFHQYVPFCDRFYFAVDADFPAHVLPDDAGLILADRYGGAIMRPAQDLRLAPARRKAMIAHFARIGAGRLHALMDPDGHQGQ